MNTIEIILVMSMVLVVLCCQYVRNTGNQEDPVYTCEKLDKYFRTNSDTSYTLYDVVIDQNYYTEDNIIRAHYATMSNDEIGHNINCQKFTTSLVVLEHRYTALALQNHLLIGAKSDKEERWDQPPATSDRPSMHDFAVTRMIVWLTMAAIWLVYFPYRFVCGVITCMQCERVGIHTRTGLGLITMREFIGPNAFDVLVQWSDVCYCLYYGSSSNAASRADAFKSFIRRQIYRFDSDGHEVLAKAPFNTRVKMVGEMREWIVKNNNHDTVDLGAMPVDDFVDNVDRLHNTQRAYFNMAKGAVLTRQQTLLHENETLNLTMIRVKPLDELPAASKALEVLNTYPDWLLGYMMPDLHQVIRGRLFIELRDDVDPDMYTPLLGQGYSVEFEQIALNLQLFKAIRAHAIRFDDGTLAPIDKTQMFLNLVSKYQESYSIRNTDAEALRFALANFEPYVDAPFKSI